MLRRAVLFVPRTSRSRADLVHALRHIKPATSFRSSYAYDNVLYIVAGELVAAVSGQSWESFMRERVFKPSGMTRSVSDEKDRFATSNRVQPHARLDPRLRGLGPQQVLPEREGLGQVSAPAGGLSSSANDLARWLQVQLARGVLPGGQGRLYSEASAQAMWAPEVQPIPAADRRHHPAIFQLRIGLDGAGLSPLRDEPRTRWQWLSTVLPVVEPNRTCLL